MAESNGNSLFDLGDYEFLQNYSSYWDSDVYTPVRPLGWNFIVLFVMAVFGIATNSALLMVIVLNRHLRTIPNILVGNLAVADLILFVFNVPNDTVQWYFFNWPDNGPGNFLCKLSGSVWSLSQVLCVASLTAVTVERYYSLRWNIHTKRTVAILVCVWAVSLVCTVPVLAWSSVRRYSPSFSLCHFLPVPAWGNPLAQGYVTAGFLLQYLFPLLVITICSVSMAIVLARSGVASTVAVRARRRLAIVVFALNISFAVCWLPNHAILLHFMYASFDTILSTSFDVYETVIEIGHVLAYVNSCLNPVIVFTISPMHRQPLVRWVCRCLRQLDPSPSDGNSGPSDRYARVLEDMIVSETEDVNEKA